MLDHQDPDDASEPSPDELRGSYPPQFDERQQPPTTEYYQAPMSTRSGHASHPPFQATSHPATTNSPFGAIAEMIDPNDPMLDADPFGLSASMHYPTSYSFEPPHQR